MDTPFTNLQADEKSYAELAKFSETPQDTAPEDTVLWPT